MLGISKQATQRTYASKISASPRPRPLLTRAQPSSVPPNVMVIAILSHGITL